MHQFDIAFEGVRSVRNIEIKKEYNSISRKEITKNMRELKSKLKRR